jgi:hypothetical protein
MSKFQFPINEMKRAAATTLLSVGVAASYIAVMAGDELNPTAQASVVAEAAVLQLDLPDRPPGGRRLRLSNAEQALPTLTYFGEPDTWGRNKAELEGAMTLFQLGGTIASKELASGTVNVTVSEDYLTAYLAMPFLGGEVFAPESGVGHPFVVSQVLTRAFAKEQLAQK